ncbi:hypothetical protein DNTS_007296, partial [Danionella cerebrum]
MEIMGKRTRIISFIARKIRIQREQKNRLRDSERFGLDYETMRRPSTGKALPMLAWADVRRETRLFTLLSGMRMFGLGRLFTRKSWVNDFIEPCYWKITKVHVDYTAEREVDNVMYHDWRLVPKHEEEEFRRCEPVPKGPPRFSRCPPLLRAMILANQEKQLGVPASTLSEPMLPLIEFDPYIVKMKNGTP